MEHNLELVITNKLFNEEASLRFTYSRYQAVDLRHHLLIDDPVLALEVGN